jgi:dsRNA-specific ribonuclease
MAFVKKQQVVYTNPYWGKRDQSFAAMIRNVLQLGLADKYIEKIMDKEGMMMFSTSFTHQSVNENDNYEFWETLGDVTLNKCVLWYISRRFPQINGPSGSDLLTRLKIKIIKSDSFSEIAESLGFWPFVTVDQSIRSGKKVKKDDMDKQSILEDVCEAFFGVLEFMIDRHIGIGYGYKICYTILASLLDRKSISLSFEDIVDYKTRVKEVFDAYKTIIGSVKYTNRPDARDPSKIYVVAYQTLPSGQSVKLGEIVGSRLDEAEQGVAKIALENLRSQGYTKSIPPEYLMFCT